jgi:hypothetical protein
LDQAASIFYWKGVLEGWGLNNYWNDHLDLIAMRNFARNVAAELVAMVGVLKSIYMRSAFLILFRIMTGASLFKILARRFARRHH